jgi:nicotinate-nucleotide pyrophosphorylase (carboxylating)
MATAIRDALVDLLPTDKVDVLIERALAEDLGSGDLTTENAVPGERQARARLVAKESGVLAGLPIFSRTFFLCDAGCALVQRKSDGDRVRDGDVIAEVEGPARALLVAERTALNFLQRMSGIATATARLVELAAGRVRVLDTRKTTPGLRRIEKYSVLCGGGENHRFGLHDQVMIKENHLDLADSDAESLTRRIRGKVGAEVVMTVEARNAEEAHGAVRGGADVVLLDNMSCEELLALVPQLRARAVELGRSVELEASGGIDEASLEAVSHCGLDRVSIGALTHSAPALDFSLYLEPLP